MKRVLWAVVCVAAFSQQRPECAAKAEAGPPPPLQPRPPARKACDPAKWNAFTPTETALAGTWVYIDGHHYTYSFDGHGHFSSVDNPDCMYVNPHCEVRIPSHPGTYTIVGPEVRLSYDPKRPHPPSQAVVVLTAQSNCKGEARLRGRDYTQNVTLRK